MRTVLSGHGQDSPDRAFPAGIQGVLRRGKLVWAGKAERFRVQRAARLYPPSLWIFGVIVVAAPVSAERSRPSAIRISDYHAAT